MFGHKLQVLLIAIASAWYSAGAANAQVAPCTDCHCTCPCEKVCRLVKEDKKVTVVCWGCQCEDICLPGRSQRGCAHCEEVCNETASDTCSAPKSFLWYAWIPGCPKEYITKKKLMRKSVIKTVPSFKWVIEDVCPTCREKYVSPEIPAGVKVPAPPRVHAKLLH